MGHQRLGILPASRNLPEIVRLLLAGETSGDVLVQAITKECDDTLQRALKDPAFVEALWLLIRIPQAAKSDRFQEALRAIGVRVPETPSEIDIAVGYDAAIESAQRTSGSGITDLSEMARQAGIAALDSLIQERLPTLWNPTREDLRTTVATLSAPDRFGELAQRFFTGFVERTIQYFLDRAIPRYVGPCGLAPSVGDLALFDTAVRRHCAEATVIMRAFAKDWLAKNAIHAGKEITRGDVTGFGAYAAEKIAKELTIRSKTCEEV